MVSAENATLTSTERQHWQQQVGAFPIQASVMVRDGEVFLPNVGDLVSDVSLMADSTWEPLAMPNHWEKREYRRYGERNTKEISVIGYPHLLARALGKLIYKAAKDRNTRNSSPDSML